MTQHDRFLTRILSRIPTCVIAAMLMTLGVAGAVAQQATPPAIGVTPLAPPPQFAAPPPDLTPQAALIGEAAPPIKTDATLCVRTVFVDGEPRHWDALEKLGQAQLGWNAYIQGDYLQAVPVFARLAKIGHPEAEFLYGFAYYAGQGVPQDYLHALDWFEKAANQGCFKAYAAVAGLYRDGKGTPTDLGKAYMWFNIATSRLPDSAERDALIQEREKVAAFLTQGQIEAAQKRSLSFQPKPVVPPDLQDLPVDYFPAAAK